MTERSTITRQRARVAGPLALALAALVLSTQGPGCIMAAGAGVPQPTYVRSIGGPGGHASMYPSGLTVDPSGTMYVADTANDQVAAYSPSGNQIWRVGSHTGGRILGNFSQPRDIAYQAGQLFVADLAYNRVQVLDASSGQAVSQFSYRFKSVLGVSAGVDGSGQPIVLATDNIANTVRIFTPSGTLVTSIGSGPGAGNGQVNQPRDAATDAAGDIYVADYDNDRIVEFSAAGVWIRNWGSRGTGAGKFNRPYGVDLGEAGNVYVADTGNNNRIQEFTGTGTFIQYFGADSNGVGIFTGLRRVAVGSGPSPQVYGADLWGYRVLRFNADGSLSATYGGVAPQTGAFNQPFGVAADATNTYVLDTNNQRVQAFDPNSGAFQFTWGIRGFGDGNPGFNWPRDLTISTATNTVWVADTKNFRLTEFDRSGNPTGRAYGGRLGSGPNQLNWPYGITSYQGDLIVADTFNNRVQRINPATNTVVWTVANLGAPKGVTMSGAVVYVADTLNGRILELNVADGSPVGTIGSGVLHKQVTGVAVEPNGDVWASDTSFNRLVKFDPSGVLLLTYGKAGSASNQFNAPSHLQVVMSGSAVDLLVVDTANDRVQVFDTGD